MQFASMYLEWRIQSNSGFRIQEMLNVWDPSKHSQMHSVCFQCWQKKTKIWVLIHSFISQKDCHDCFLLSPKQEEQLRKSVKLRRLFKDSRIRKLESEVSMWGKNHRLLKGQGDTNIWSSWGQKEALVYG